MEHGWQLPQRTVRCTRSLFAIGLPQAYSVILCCLAAITPATAQITPDSTLGAEGSVVTPNVNINGIPAEQIDGGAIRGANLFHSFQEFNVGSATGAYFTNPSGIENILSRVTGSNPSNILGTLGVLGNANLFLINPNGIVFGPASRLDVGGSFVASTASAVNFADGTFFSATESQTTPLLTISIPTGLQYRSNAGSIQVQGSSLFVPNGETLALVGGLVSLDGASWQAPGAHVELGGVAGAGTVGLNANGNDLRLSFPDDVARADVSLDNGAQVNVRAGGGGSIAINAQNLNIAGQSRLRVGIDSGMGSVDSIAGDIEFNAQGAINLTEQSVISNAVLAGGVGNGGDINITTGSLSVTNGSVISNSVLEGGVGNGGDINITTGSLSVTNGAQLQTPTFGQGDAGKVTITAKDTVSFDGLGSAGFPSSAISAVQPGAVGKVGGIEIATGSLSLTNGGTLSATTFGNGDAGSVTIIARDAVSVDGKGNDTFFSGASSLVGRGAVGNGGEINITTGSLSVTNGGILDTTTLGQGNGGRVTIIARDTVSFDGVDSNGVASRAYSLVGFGGVGNGGDINVTTGSLSLTNGAILLANTQGQGDAGNVTITAQDTVSFGGVNSNGFPSAAASQVYTTGVGDGGDINITTGSLSLTNGASLSADTAGQGDAGSVTITAKDTVSFDGVDSNGFSSGAFSQVRSGAVGNGGGINITTGSLSLTNTGILRAGSEGNGSAGNIEVSANSIRLDNNALINADTIAGQGNITLDFQDLVLRRGSNITTNATGTATGGNITIGTGVLAALENSDISANAQESFGGRIAIDAQGIFGTQFRSQPTDESDITATSELGAEFSGTVELNTPDVDPSRGLVSLPVDVVDPASLIAQNPCSRGEGSEFIVTGRGGLPPNPSEALTRDAVRVGLVEPAQSTSNPARATLTPPSTGSTAEKIVPAQGWVTNARGEVVLIAYDPTGTGSQRQRRSPAAACPQP